MINCIAYDLNEVNILSRSNTYLESYVLIAATMSIQEPLQSVDPIHRGGICTRALTAFATFARQKINKSTVNR